MKIRKQIVSLVVLVLSTPCAFAAAKGGSGPRYFYALLQDGAANEWNYKIPDCAALADKTYRKLRRGCQTIDENSSRCPTEKTVTLKHAAPATSAATPVPQVMTDAQKVDDTTKTFRLDYIVFVSQKTCLQARERASHGD